MRTQKRQKITARDAYSELSKKIANAPKGKKPAILISGLRGIGKTTLMLQLFGKNDDAFYFSADSILARNSTLYELAEQIYRAGNSIIFIDEIHKYPGWADEVKNIYDDFDIQLVCSGSSTAAIKKGSIMLGRRAYSIPLNPLGFGEFFFLKNGSPRKAGLEDATDRRSAIEWLARNRGVEKYYSQYLNTGGFPMQAEEGKSIFRLIKRMIYEDVLAEFSLTENKVDLAERLLGSLSISKPGEFSYTSFSSSSGYAKSSVYDAVSMLCELELLDMIEEKTPKAKAKKTMKLLFSHPSLRSSLASQMMKRPEIGALREDYFVFHMQMLGLLPSIPKGMRKRPDYELSLNGEKLLFEIGGDSKGAGQLEGRKGITMNDEQLMVLGFVQKSDQKP